MPLIAPRSTIDYGYSPAYDSTIARRFNALLGKEYNKVGFSIKKSLESTMRAFVLINTDLRFMEAVQQTLLSIDGVADVHSLYGEYDLLAIVHVKTMKQLKEVIGWQIRKVENIRSSHTLIVMEYD